jgi:hypothetical protein
MDGVRVGRIRQVRGLRPPFPATIGQTQISIAGGRQPEWRRDGKELFYISADAKLTAVPVTTDDPTFSVGAPHAPIRRRGRRAERALPERLRGHRRWTALPRQHRGRSADAPSVDRDPQLDGGSQEVGGFRTSRSGRTRTGQDYSSKVAFCLATLGRMGHHLRHRVSTTCPAPRTRTAIGTIAHRLCRPIRKILHQRTRLQNARQPTVK